MGRLETKKQQSKLKKQRVRAKFTGTAKRPRLSINISNRHIRAQLIDDVASNTVASVSTVTNKKHTGLTLMESAKLVGQEIAEAAKAKKISSVVFDRGSLKYHGRAKALADAARETGLEF